MGVGRPIRVCVVLAALCAALAFAGTAQAATPSFPTHRCGSFLYWTPPQAGEAGWWWRIDVTFRDVSCVTAMSVIRTLWFGPTVTHGGPSDALAWYTMPRFPSWRCIEGPQSGLCNKDTAAAGFTETVVNLPPADPCALQWPGGLSTRHSGGRLIYSRSQSLQNVCEGFGTDTGGLSIDWLTPGMKCTLIAAALKARYGTEELFTDGACSAAELAQHPGVVSALGAACATASDLLGLSMPVIGQLSGLACDASPAVGTAFGAHLEAHHEFQVAQDVIHRGRCLEFRQYFGVSSWHAVGCVR
jgi:hypothetical protein